MYEDVPPAVAAMTETKPQLKVLFLEDNPDDVELELYELRKGGFEIVHQTARNKDEFFKVLQNLQADIIIADYSLPDITGIEAIHTCREKGIDLPVILITGMGNEQLAVDSLREGAIDYILKKNIQGFAARVSRALDIWADRQTIKLAEEERKRLQSQLFQSQKMESVGRLAGGIAHDFNNLLTGIMGYAGLSLKMLPANSPAATNQQKIIDVSKKASDLIKQLLVFSRKIPLEFKSVDMNALIRDKADFIHRVVEATVEIELQLEDGLPEVDSDVGQISQVLINLAVNARDAMEGKGVLCFKTEKCRGNPNVEPAGGALKAKEYVCISVSDTGCGIRKDILPKIFDPFFTTKEVGKGTGLGLSIIYSIINGHGGWVDVESEVGKGSVFKVYLPVIERAVDADRTDPPSDDVEDTADSLHGRETILIVEDEEILKSYTTDMLKDLGYTILTAKNGEEGLEVFRQHSQDIDLVLSDMIMPKKSGLEMFADIKRIKPDIKFVLVTGYCLDEVQGHILRDMEAILMKPYTTEKLASMLRTVFQHTDES